jgi:hypothetical protein
MFLISILLLASVNEVYLKSSNTIEVILNTDNNKNLPRDLLLENEKDIELPKVEYGGSKPTFDNSLSIVDHNNIFQSSFATEKWDIPVSDNTNNTYNSDKTSEIWQNNIFPKKAPNYGPENDPWLIKEYETSEVIKNADTAENNNIFNGYFTMNKGQVINDSVRYYIQDGGVWFLDDGIVIEQRKYVEIMDLESNEKDQNEKLKTDPMVGFEPNELVEYCNVVLKLEFSGANLIKPKGVNKLSWNNNYFYGNDSMKWYTRVPNYQEIIYENLYENIDLRYYLTEFGLKYDFIVHTGGNPEDIKIKIDGAKNMFIDNNGDLRIKTELGEIIDSDLHIYQKFNKNEKLIKGEFKKLNGITYSFEILSEYDRNQDLIIDPVIFSTCIGGNKADIGNRIIINSSENAIIAGFTNSLNFPTTSGTNITKNISGEDIFIFQLNQDGSKMMFATFIGGSVYDIPLDITIDDLGNIFVTGQTFSLDFPVTSYAYQNSTTFGGSDGFILKLNPNGSIMMFSTYIGGSNWNYCYSIALDSNNNPIVAGTTGSTDFPITPGVYDTTHNGGYYDAFVLKLNNVGTKLIYSTFLGGSQRDYGTGVEIDSSGNVIVVGYTVSSDFPITSGAYDTSFNGGADLFILGLNQSCSKLLFSTFLGGSKYESVYQFTISGTDDIFITGVTNSQDFPTTSGALNRSYNGGSYDIYIIKFNPNASSLNYSTYLGGNSGEFGWDIAIDNEGSVYITGSTHSKDFPITPDAFDKTINGTNEAFCLKLDPSGSMINYSTFIGGNDYEIGHGIITDSHNNFYVTGYTNSSDFLITPGVYYPTKNWNGSNDCFVVKLGGNKINNPPIINYFNATRAPEGSKVYFTVNATDPDKDNLTYSFDFQNDNKFDYVGKNNTASYTWGDDYIGTAVVKVSDGNNIVEANTSVVVFNVVPTFEAIIVKNATKFSQDIVEEWVLKYDGPGYGDDVAESIAVDLSGNVYVTGWSNSINPTHAKYSNYNFTTIKYDTNGKVIWKAIYDSPGVSYDKAVSIVVDSLGNTYVTGFSVDHTKGINNYNFTTIKYDQNGNEKWVVVYDGGRTDIPVKIVLDHNGDIYVTGTSQLVDNNNNPIYQQIITIKYDSNGKQIWLRRYNGPQNWSSVAQDMVVDSFDNIYILGTCGKHTIINRSLKTDSDYILISYDPLGKLRWTAFYDGPVKKWDIGSKIALDTKNNVYVTGWSYGNGSNYDYATIAYNSTGKELWVARYNGPNNYFDVADDISVGSSGNVYVTGQTYGNSIKSNYTTIAYDKNGSELWVRKYNNPNNSWNIPGRIVVDPSTELIFITGSCYYNNTGDDFTTIIYNKSGKEVWVERYNGPSNGSDHPHDIVMDKFGNVYVTGYSNYYKNYPFNRNFTTIKYSILNYYECNEGSIITFNATAKDPGSDDLNFTWVLNNEVNLTNIFYNNGLGPDSYPSPNGTYPFSMNDAINCTFPDDGIYNLSLTVTDDDGLNSTYLTRIIVNNVAPKVNLTVFTTEVNKTQSANLSVRIAGEKWHDVKVELYKNGKEITNGSIIRYPGSPNEQMLHFNNHTIDSSSNWSAILYYTPENDLVNGKPNGATPCWIIMNLSNGSQIKLHHTFKVKHKDTHIWRVNLTEVLPSNGNSSRKGTFNITVYDPGADDIILYLDFGDGANITKFYPNTNQTFPVSINLTLSHDYTSSGTFSVILIAKDDDGGITTVKVTIDFG